MRALLTVAQDEATSVVYGMPKEAVNRGGVDVSMALTRIPDVRAAEKINYPILLVSKPSFCVTDSVT